MEGWIKIHRQLIDWEWYTDGNTLRLFLHLLLIANHEDKKWRGKEIKRGSTHTSISHLGKALKLSDKQIRCSLDKLKNSENVAIKGASDGTMISVCNYDSYQDLQKPKGEQKGKRGANEGQQLKNDKNDKEIYLYNLREKFLEITSDEDWIKERQNYHPRLDIKKTIEKACVDYWSTDAGFKNKQKSKSENIDWKATFNNALSQKQNQVWINNDFESKKRINLSEIDIYLQEKELDYIESIKPIMYNTTTRAVISRIKEYRQFLYRQNYKDVDIEKFKESFRNWWLKQRD